MRVSIAEQQRLETFANRRDDTDYWSLDDFSNYLNLLVLTGEYRKARTLAEQRHLQKPEDPDIAYEFASFLAHEDDSAGLKWYGNHARRNSDSFRWGYLLSVLESLAGHRATGLSTLREILMRCPPDPRLLGNYVNSSMFVADLDPIEHLSTLRHLVNRHFGASTLPFGSVSKRPRYTIGFVCCNLRCHAISQFLIPLLQHLDRKKFMTVIFSSTVEEDDVSAFLCRLCDIWYSTQNMEHDELLSLIRGERIDVLIDLDNHSVPNRMPVFAKRAAPIQMAFYGYNTSTGLGSMDYRLTDPVVDPSGNEAHYTEKLLRIRRCHVAYHPFNFERMPQIPRDTNDIVFGSFNDWKKIEEPQVGKWASILNEFPRSKLNIVGFDNGLARLRFERWIRNSGIDEKRVSILGRLGFAELCQQIELVDIALDSWPFGGAVTSAVVLSHGVPLLTAMGPRAVSRVTAAMSRELLLDQYIAASPDQFSELASRVPKNLDSLTADRESLQRRFATTIGDGADLANQVGELLIRAIERYRNGRPTENDTL